MNEPIRINTSEGVIVGYKECPKWLHDAYERACGYQCSLCWNHFKTLHAHRLKRGNQGGLYTVAPLNTTQSNVKMVCDKCHKKIHAKEQGCRNR